MSRGGECLEDKKYTYANWDKKKKFARYSKDNTKLFMSFKNRVKDHSGVNIYGEGQALSRETN